MTKTKTEKRRLSELKLVYPLYPRASLDSQHVGYMCDALRAGYEFPPIVIDDQNRVVDGFHRLGMYRRELADDAEVGVIVKHYANDGEFFLDAIRYNAEHGQALTTYDRSNIILTAKTLKIERAELAAVMHLRVEKLKLLEIGRMARTYEAKPGKSGRVIPIKRTISHMAGERLTEGQRAANEKLGGMKQLFYVNQVILLLANDLLDRENEELLKRLRELGRLIDKECGVTA